MPLSSIERIVPTDGSYAMTTLQRTVEMNAVLLSDYYPMAVAVPVYGYVMPVFALIVTVSNSIVVCIFSRKNMRSATNLVLGSIAVVVLAALLIPMPAYVYMFTFGHWREYVPYDLCIVYAVTVVILPHMIHTAWLWLTLLLAIQRFLCVTRPMLVRSIFTLKRTYTTIFVILVASTILHWVRFWEVEFRPQETKSQIFPNRTIVGCVFNNSMPIERDKYLYMNFHGWMTIILDGFLPCTALIVFDSMMLYRLRKSENVRLELQCDKDKSKHGTDHHKESTRISWMVFSIIAIIIVLEIPWSCEMAYFLAKRTEILPIQRLGLEMVISEFIMCVSYSSIFVIYCLMSSAFRRALRQLLSCDIHTKDETVNSARATFL